MTGKQKKRVQFILEETQENDESNTAALSEANPSQSFDEQNRLDTVDSALQDKQYFSAQAKAGGGVDPSTYHSNRTAHVRKRQLLRKQKQALREFDRKERAERRNEREIAYQFISSQPQFTGGQ